MAVGNRTLFPIGGDALKVPAWEADYCFFELARLHAAAASDNSSATNSRCSGMSRRASSIFFCASMSPSLLGRHEAFRPGNEDVDFYFIVPSYTQTTCPSPFRQPCDDLLHSPFSQPGSDQALLHSAHQESIDFSHYTSSPVVRKAHLTRWRRSGSSTAPVERALFHCARSTSKGRSALHVLSSF